MALASFRTKLERQSNLQPLEDAAEQSQGFFAAVPGSSLGAAKASSAVPWSYHGFPLSAHTTLGTRYDRKV
jgi:hypothetical protein